jgi:hypothetical protein
MEKWEKSFLHHLDGTGTEFSRFLEKLDVNASRKEKSPAAIYDGRCLEASAIWDGKSNHLLSF